MSQPRKRPKIGLQKDSRLAPLHPGARDSRATPRQATESVNASPRSSPDVHNEERSVSPETAATDENSPAWARGVTAKIAEQEWSFDMMASKRKLKTTYGGSRATPSAARKASNMASSSGAQQTQAATEDSPIQTIGTQRKTFKMPPEISRIKPEFRMPAAPEPSSLTPPRPEFKVPPTVERIRPTFRKPSNLGAEASHLLFQTDIVPDIEISSSPSNSVAPIPHSSPELIPSSNTTGSLMTVHPTPEEASTNICPICKAPVSMESLTELRSTLASARPHDRSRFNQQAAFCRSHREASGRKQWKERSYPSIDWSGLPKRLEQYRPTLLAILRRTQPSHFRAELEAQLEARRAKGEHVGRETLAREFARDGDGAETVGYYGGRGAGAMMNWLATSLARPLREAQNKDPLVNACGSVSAFVQRVLVPELATLLVVEDMQAERDSKGGKKVEKAKKDGANDKSDQKEKKGNRVIKSPQPKDASSLQVTDAKAEAARERLKESADLGRLLCQEIDDEIAGEDSEADILTEIESEDEEEEEA